MAVQINVHYVEFMELENGTQKKIGQALAYFVGKNLVEKADFLELFGVLILKDGIRQMH